jgi:hypothetical protein
MNLYTQIQKEYFKSFKTKEKENAWIAKKALIYLKREMKKAAQKGEMHISYFYAALPKKTSILSKFIFLFKNPRYNHEEYHFSHDVNEPTRLKIITSLIADGFDCNFSAYDSYSRMYLNISWERKEE